MSVRTASAKWTARSMFSSSLNIGYTTEMLGLLVVMHAVPDPPLKPTIDYCAIDHALHSIVGEVVAKHGISRHRMRFPEVTQRCRVDNEHRGMCFPICLKHLPHPRKQTLPFVCHLTRPAGVGANQM